MVDCVQKTFRNEGFFGFYKGTATPLVGIGVCVSIQFGVVEYMKRMYRHRNAGADLNMTQLYISGAVSGTVNSVVSGPVEHIRIRLQTQNKNSPVQYRGPIDCIKGITGQHGITGLYRGHAATVLREFQGFGVYFASYEWLIQRTMQEKKVSREEISPAYCCLYGALAGLGMWIATYPVDVVKSKMQTDSFTKPQYKGSLDCARQVWAAEGARGFLRGLSPTLLRAMPVNAATFAAFEMTMRYIS